MKRRITRRKFMIDGAITTAGAMSAVAFGSTLIKPSNAVGAPVKFHESDCNTEKGGNRRILIAYASFCGSTGGVAERIGQVLCKNGATVDIRLVKHVKDLNSYGAVVVGSAVHSSKWRSEAIEFVIENSERLSKVPVAYFLTCLALYKNSDHTRQTARGYMDPVLKEAPKVMPVDMGFFAGTLDYSKLNVIYRMVMKRKMKKQGVPEGDFRNWNAIEKWANRLHRRIDTGV